MRDDIPDLASPNTAMHASALHEFGSVELTTMCRCALRTAYVPAGSMIPCRVCVCPVPPPRIAINCVSSSLKEAHAACVSTQACARFDRSFSSSRNDRSLPPYSVSSNALPSFDSGPHSVADDFELLPRMFDALGQSTLRQVRQLLSDPPQTHS